MYLTSTLLCPAELTDDFPEGWSRSSPCYRIFINPVDEGESPEAADAECETPHVASSLHGCVRWQPCFDNTMGMNIIDPM